MDDSFVGLPSSSPILNNYQLHIRIAFKIEERRLFHRLSGNSISRQEVGEQDCRFRILSTYHRVVDSH